ncbi:MAG: TIGR02281 family clan AA aspartic protease [Parahaliea sp.]
MSVEALLPNTAVMVINGSRKTLRAGQSDAGVKLISANAKSAVIEIDGQRKTVKLHDRVSGSYQAPTERKVDILRNAHMQYMATATINGRKMSVLVDTGANVVALNSRDAKTLGIDYQAGKETRLTTASDVVRAWVVNLQYVDVGGIRIDNVRATVSEGAFPETILLGMTYLKHVKMVEAGGILTLSRDW